MALSKDPAFCFLQTLEVVKAEAESLANSVKQTSNLSERVSRKVRELDTAQSRINGTLESIDYIVNRTNAVDGVQQALQTEDYEAAAQYVNTLLQSEDKYGNVHQDSSIKQSEQQSRVSKSTSCLTDQTLKCFICLAMFIVVCFCIGTCVSAKGDFSKKGDLLSWCRYLQKPSRSSRRLYRHSCRRLCTSRNMTQWSALCDFTLHLE